MENIMLKLLICMVVLIIAVIILVKAIKALFNNLHFDADKITLNSKWVMDKFYDAAHYLIQEKYNMLGKRIRTQKGTYRANYMNEVDQTAATIINTCCEGDMLSKDFRDYIHANYPNIRRKELWDAIADYREYRENSIQQDMNEFLKGVQDITPEEFFEIKKHQRGDVVGVYIIHNETNDRYYVGQAKKLFFRINQHFTGHGNGDVYADYKYGDDFAIKIIRLSESGYDDIDLLEKDMIAKYHAYDIGYNKTSGNS